MLELQIKQIATRNDNYVYLIREPEQNRVAVIDPSDYEPVKETLEELGWQLTDILNTHHHNDHTGGNIELKQRYGCTITGPRADHDRVAGIDVDVGDGDKVFLGNTNAEVLDTPGHTRGHIAFWFPDSHALFCGDTLFVLGCGRTFEGTAEQMWASLQKLRNLPDKTRVFCAHEYTQANAKFAVTIEPTNVNLVRRVEDIDNLRAQGQPTVPSILEDEKSCNPFLRCDVPEVASAVSLSADSPVSVFAKLRSMKDNF